MRRAPVVPTAIAVGVGSVVLLDVLLDVPLLNLVGAALAEYGVIVAAFALVLGVLNLLSVHARTVQRRAAGWPYSLALLFVTVALAALGLWRGPDDALVGWTFANVLLPLQAAFFSLLAFFVLGVAYRALRVRSVESLLFVASAVIVLVGATPLGALIGPAVADLRHALMTIPAAAATRGLLLGIALGTLITALRLLADGRKYFR